MAHQLSLQGEQVEEISKEEKEDLLKRIEELKRSNAALNAENDMFEGFISHLDPLDKMCLNRKDDLEAAEASQPQGAGGGRSHASQSDLSDELHQLTLEQKMYVAQTEIKETRQQQEKVKQKLESIQDNYKATLKVAELHLAEVKKAKNIFERRVIKPSMLKKLEPETVFQYLEDKSKVTQLEKLKRENSVLENQMKKLQQQLRQKKEMGKAEYKEIFQDLDEPSDQVNLGKIQAQYQKVQHVLRSHREKLQLVTLKLTGLDKDISNKKQFLAKLEEETRRVEKEHLKAEVLNKHLRGLMEDYEAPDVTEYMYVKEKHRKLQKDVHTLERRARISQMALKSHSKARDAQRDAGTPAFSAEAGAGSGGNQIPVKLPHIPAQR